MRTFLLILLAVLYALWPFDLIADLLPGLGWIDDAALIYLVWYLYRKALRPSSAGTRSYGPGSTSGSTDGGEDRSGPKNPFDILGLPQNAPPEEIARAYRQLAAKYHPDKVQHLGEEFQRLAEERFKEIQAAYDELKKQGRA
jgi:hypothetical protein